MINPNFLILTNTRGSVWQRSIGAYQLAHHCRVHGLTAQVIDFTDLFSLEELMSIVNKFVSNDLIAVGVSTTFYSNTDEEASPIVAKNASSNLKSNIDIEDKIKIVLETVKLNSPSIKIIAGGANSWQVANNPLFDAVFHGYSEEAVVKYLKNQKYMIFPKVGTTSIINGDLEQFNVNALDHRYLPQDIILNNETLPIEIARGCIFKCRFCSYPLNGKKKLDYLRNSNLIKEELEYNYTNFGTTNYFFTDDTFNDSTEKIVELHKIFTSLTFKINFVCYLRIDLLIAHPDQIQLLKEMGLRSVVFGIETFHRSASKVVGKGANPERIKSMLLDLYYKHWNQEVSITCSMIIGLPGESEEHVRKSFNWFRCDGKDLCDSWWPLTINSSGHYRSEFDINHSKYGYRLNTGGEEWVSDTMTHSKAFALSQEFNNIGMFSDNQPGSWMIMAMRSYGYTQEEIMSWSVKNIPWRTLIKKRLRLFSEYKRRLQTLAN